MSQPTTYDRQYSFSSFQTVNPDDPLPASKVDLELNTIKTTLDQIMANLALIQRDDGEIANSAVGVDQMDGSLISLAFERPSNWATATAYSVDSAVFQNNKLYICEIAHTSGVFATDLAAVKWVESIDFSSLVTLADAAAAAAAVSAGQAQAAQAAAESAVALALPLTGGTMSGPIVTSGDATLATQAPRLGQVQSGIVQHAVSTGGTADAITTVHSPVRTAWAAGMRGTFTAGAANTTATPTMDPDGVGPKTFLKNNLQALAAGDIAGAGHEVEWEYNGTNLILLNPSLTSASATAAGIVELATDAETQTGTDTARAITPANLTAKEAVAGGWFANTANRILTTDIAWGDAAEVTLADAATIAVDMATFLNAKVTLAGNRTLGQPTNTKVGQCGVIRIIQDATGTRTLAYHADWKFTGGSDPVATVTASATDLLFYQVIATNFIYATLVKGVA